MHGAFLTTNGEAPKSAFCLALERNSHQMKLLPDALVYYSAALERRSTTHERNTKPILCLVWDNGSGFICRGSAAIGKRQRISALGLGERTTILLAANAFVPR
jgi:hypothetical protein